MTEEARRNRRLLPTTRRRCRPRRWFIVLRRREVHTQDTPSSLGFAHDIFEMSTSNAAHRRKKGPLIVMWGALVIEENAVAVTAAVLLQRQCDQIAESPVRQGVLIREESVVRVEAEIRPALHRLGQDVRAELSCMRGSHGLFEEQPHVAAAPRTRPLECSRQIHRGARVHKRGRVFEPTALVEVDRQEEARFIQEHRVNTGHERLTGLVSAGEVPSNHFIGDRQKATVRTLPALDARFFADAPDPLVGARGCVADFPVFRLSNRRGYTSSRPRKSERNSAIFSSDEES